MLALLPKNKPHFFSPYDKKTRSKLLNQLVNKSARRPSVDFSPPPPPNAPQSSTCLCSHLLPALPACSCSSSLLASSLLRLHFLGSCQQCLGARTDGSAVLSAASSISHPSAAPREGNRSPAFRSSKRASRERRRELGRGGGGGRTRRPHLQLFPGRKL